MAPPANVPSVFIEINSEFVLELEGKRGVGGGMRRVGRTEGGEEADGLGGSAWSACSGWEGTSGVQAVAGRAKVKLIAARRKHFVKNVVNLRTGTALCGVRRRVGYHAVWDAVPAPAHLSALRDLREDRRDHLVRQHIVRRL